MPKLSRITINIVSNWMIFVLNAAISLALTPFVLNHIGKEQYGIWALINSFIGYYGMLDFGIRGGINQYLTRYYAVQDYTKASECLSTGIASLSLVGIVLLVISLILSYILAEVFSIPYEFKNETFWCVLIVGSTSAIQCFFIGFSAVFTAKQRFDLANYIGCATRIILVVCIYLTLSSGNGLIGLSIATCGTNIFDYAIRFVVSRKISPEIEISFNNIAYSTLKDITGFGIWNFLISVSAHVYQHMQTLIVGVLMEISAVTHFALSVALISQIREILSPIGHVLYPVAAEMHSKKELDQLAKLYKSGSRILTSVSLSLAVVASFWAEDFFRLWIGEQYISGQEFPSVAVLFQILLINLILTNSCSIAWHIMIASNKIEKMAKVAITETTFNLIFTTIFGYLYGLYGVAGSSIATSMIVRLIVIPRIIRKELNIALKDHFKSICIRPLFVCCLLVLISVAIRNLWVVTGWWSILCHGIVFTTAAVISLFFIGLEKEEKERFIETFLVKRTKMITNPKN